MTARSRGRVRCEIHMGRLGALLGGVVLLISAAVAGGYWGLRFNLTPSAPLGLWKIVELDRAVHKGDRVFVCPPASDIMIEALRRGYLRRGLCAGGVAPLIKTVAATSGQVVEIGHLVRIDGEILPHSQLMARDGRGRALGAYVGGLVSQGCVYLHSDFPGSFDSRYLGPVATSNILGLAQEVWTHGP